MDGIIDKKALFTNKDLRKLIIPLMVEQLFGVTVGMADSIMVASVGESAVSAISLVDTVNVLLFSIFAALATGGAVVVGQYMGQKRIERGREAGNQLIVFVTLISLLIMSMMYIGRGFILNVVFGKIEADVSAFANTYMLITFASIPFLAIYNSGAALFRTMGNSKITMKTSLIMNLINIGGNAICIYVFRMSVEGVAIPTLVSRIVAAVLIMIMLRNKELPIHIGKIFPYKIDKHLVKKIFRIGVPNGIENSMFQLGKIVLLSVVAGFGTSAITANAVGNTVSLFQILPGMAMGLGIVTVVSRCVGAGDYNQVRYYTKKLIKFEYIALIILNIGIYFALPLIFKLYGLSSETASMARQVIIFHGVNTAISWPLSFTLPNVLRASNDAKFTMITGVGSMWFVRIGCGILLSQVFGMGMFGVWVAMIIDWCIRGTIFVIRYRGNRWQVKSSVKNLPHR